MIEYLIYLFRSKSIIQRFYEEIKDVEDQENRRLITERYLKELREA